MERTIQLSKGQGKASLRHNNRDFISPNVDRERIKDNIIIKQEDLGTAYEKIFGKAQAEYNAKQKRADRKIGNYFEKLFGKKPSSEIIQNGNKTKSYYEFVAGVGDMHDTGYDTNPDAAKTAEQCLLDYINGNSKLGIKSFQERNPNLYIFNAIIHADEKTPHLHFDFIPYADGYKKGMTRQQGYDKAIQQMGYKNFDDFIHSERAILRQISESHGFEIAKEKESQRVTLPKQAFIEMNKAQRKNEELKQENEEFKKQIAEAKKIVMTADIPPRPEVKELPENPTRKDKKEHEKELKAAKEWDDKYKLLQAAQITVNANAAEKKALNGERQELGKKKSWLKQKVDEFNQQVRAFNKENSDFRDEKEKFDEEKELFKKNKNFIIAAEAQRRAEQILADYGIQPEGYGVDEQIKQAQRAAAAQEQKGAER